MAKDSGDRRRHRSVSNSGMASGASSGAPAVATTPSEAAATTPPAARFIVVWQFEVAEQNVAAFEAAYGPDGDWARLFRTSPDYCGTELLRDAYIPGVYLTIDRWASEDAFRAFRRAHDADYETLDRQCDSLTAKETRIGAYTL